MTRFEQLTEAFPLHIQRIAELANSGGILPALKNLPAAVTPGMALRGAFLFASTSEGSEYWNAIADGADQ